MVTKQKTGTEIAAYPHVVEVRIQFKTQDLATHCHQKGWLPLPLRVEFCSLSACCSIHLIPRRAD